MSSNCPTEPSTSAGAAGSGCQQQENDSPSEQQSLTNGQDSKEGKCRKARDGSTLGQRLLGALRHHLGGGGGGEQRIGKEKVQ